VDAAWRRRLSLPLDHDSANKARTPPAECPMRPPHAFSFASCNTDLDTRSPISGPRLFLAASPCSRNSSLLFVPSLQPASCDENHRSTNSRDHSLPFPETLSGGPAEFRFLRSEGLIGPAPLRARCATIPRVYALWRRRRFAASRPGEGRPGEIR